MLYLNYLFLIFEWSACKLAGQAKCSFHYKQAFNLFNSVTFNTVEMIRAGKYFSQLVRADKLSRLDIDGLVEWKMHLINEFTKAKIRHEPLEERSALYTVYASFFKAKIRHEPLGGTSALCIVYASFFKQRSDISHAKGQAGYTLFFNKGRTIRKLIGGGGGGGRGRSTKKVFAQGKIK